MQTLPTLETLRQTVTAALATRNLSAVARDSGIDYGAMYRFLKQGHEPKYELIQKLTAYLAKPPEGQASDGPAV
jgi:DNA-binding phage protein